MREVEPVYMQNGELLSRSLESEAYKQKYREEASYLQTSMPARTIFSSTSSDDDAGPIVHTILVFHAVGWAANERVRIARSEAGFEHIFEYESRRRACVPSLLPLRNIMSKGLWSAARFPESGKLQGSLPL